MLSDHRSQALNRPWSASETRGGGRLDGTIMNDEGSTRGEMFVGKRPLKGQHWRKACVGAFQERAPPRQRSRPE